MSCSKESLLNIFGEKGALKKHLETMDASSVFFFLTARTIDNYLYLDVFFECKRLRDICLTYLNSNYLYKALKKKNSFARNFLFSLVGVEELKSVLKRLKPKQALELMFQYCHKRKCNFISYQIPNLICLVSDLPDEMFWDSYNLKKLSSDTQKMLNEGLVDFLATVINVGEIKLFIYIWQKMPASRREYLISRIADKTKVKYNMNLLESLDHSASEEKVSDLLGILTEDELLFLIMHPDDLPNQVAPHLRGTSSIISNIVRNGLNYKWFTPLLSCLSSNTIFNIFFRKSKTSDLLKVEEIIQNIKPSYFCSHKQRQEELVGSFLTLMNDIDILRVFQLTNMVSNSKSWLENAAYEDLKENYLLIIFKWTIENRHFFRCCFWVPCDEKPSFKRLVRQDSPDDIYTLVFCYLNTCSEGRGRYLINKLLGIRGQNLTYKHCLIQLYGKFSSKMRQPLAEDNYEKLLVKYNSLLKEYIDYDSCSYWMR